MARKTPPLKNNPDITEAKFRSMIASALRNASRWWRPKIIAFNNACVGIKVNKKTGKRCKHYRCANCGGLFVAKDVQMDHVEPIINPKDGFTTWDEYINNMFSPVENYQCLCCTCHSDKTLKEKQLKKKYELERRDNTKANKNNKKHH